MKNKLVEKFGYKKEDSEHYYLDDNSVIYSFPNKKCVSINGRMYRIEFLEAVVSARPKHYAGKKALPIPSNFKEECDKGLTYPQLMKMFNVGRKTIAKWKKTIR